MFLEHDVYLSYTIVFDGFRWGSNAILTACIRRHIEKQGGKLDTNPLVRRHSSLLAFVTVFTLCNTAVHCAGQVNITARLAL